MNNNMATTPDTKNLGDLFIIPSNALMLAILRAVDSKQAHKSTGCNQSVSFLFYFLFVLDFLFPYLDCFYLPGPWNNVLELPLRVRVPCEITRSLNAFMTLGKKW
jgi:hypothetical protein